MKISKERELQVEKVVHAKTLMWKYAMLGISKDNQGGPSDWIEMNRRRITGAEVKEGEETQVIQNFVGHKQALQNLLGERDKKPEEDFEQIG